MSMLTFINIFNSILTDHDLRIIMSMWPFRLVATLRRLESDMILRRLKSGNFKAPKKWHF